jgi:hypothetical protein
MTNRRAIETVFLFTMFDTTFFLASFFRLSSNPGTSLSSASQCVIASKFAWIKRWTM